VANEIEIFARLVFVLHKEEDVATAADEKDLHDGVVEGHPSIEEVNIARHKNYHVEGLGFER
jgi:hypothetical protein